MTHPHAPRPAAQLFRHVQTPRALAALAGEGDLIDTTLWIGDSHTYYNLGVANSRWRLSEVDQGAFVWGLGPRLLYSVASHGWPRDVNWGLRALGRKDAPQRPRLCVFALGEIDVRCHLGERVESPYTPLEFVADYVELCRHLSRKSASEPVICVPVPPAGSEQNSPGYPKRGSLPRRVQAHSALRSALVREAHRRGVPVLDATERLSGSDGSLDPSLTSDGVHVNASGALLIQQELARIRETQESPISVRWRAEDRPLSRRTVDSRTSSSGRHGR